MLLYARGLGVRVVIRNYDPGFPAEWAHEPSSEITIYKKAHTSKTDLILSLLHELSHHKYHVLNNKKPLSDALLLENERKAAAKPLPKKLRKEIAEFEIDSLELMTNIAAELDLKIPMWKILAAQEFDKWQYEVYLETGNFPTLRQNKLKKTELKTRYRK